jgi:hypothetical protein
MNRPKRNKYLGNKKVTPECVTALYMDDGA